MNDDSLSMEGRHAREGAEDADAQAVETYTDAESSAYEGEVDGDAAALDGEQSDEAGAWLSQVWSLAAYDFSPWDASPWVQQAIAQAQAENNLLGNEKVSGTIFKMVPDTFVLHFVLHAHRNDRGPSILGH